MANLVRFPLQQLHSPYLPAVRFSLFRCAGESKQSAKQGHEFHITWTGLIDFGPIHDDPLLDVSAPERATPPIRPSRAPNRPATSSHHHSLAWHSETRAPERQATAVYARHRNPSA